MEIHDVCSVCGLRFSRESGYFIGAMYIEYGASAFILTLLTVAIRAVRPLALLPALGLAFVVYAPAIPYTIRLSRTLWIYWDQAVDPEKK
jgi:hypothetical protein